MWIVLALLFIVLCLVVYQDIARRRSRSWRLLSKFPGDNPLPLIGNAIQTGLDSDEMSHNLMKMWKKHNKKTFRVTVGSEDWVLLCDPEDVAKILSHPTELAKPLERNAAMLPFFGNSISSSVGDKWKSARKLVTSTFNFKTEDQRLDIINMYSTRLIEILDKDKEKGALDMYRYLKALFFDSVCTSLMGVNYKYLENLDTPYLVTGKNVIAMLTANYFAYWRTIHPLFVLTPLYQKMLTTIRNIRGTSDKMIAQRKEKLQVILNKDNIYESNIKDVADVKDTCLLDKFILSKLPDGSPLPDELINEEISLICFTAHYTTSLTISHALHFMAKYPDIQQKVIEEQLAIFKDDKLRYPTNKDLVDMKYLEAVIKETLRLIPTVAKIGRQLKEDLVLKDNRVVPAGASVVVFYEALNSNEELFAEPEKFYPERFFDNIVPYSFLPFSAGPRNCIGAKYAWQLMKSALSNILRRYEFHQGGPGLEPQIVHRMLTESKNGVQLRLTTRSI